MAMLNLTSKSGVVKMDNDPLRGHAVGLSVRGSRYPSRRNGVAPVLSPVGFSPLFFSF